MRPCRKYVVLPLIAASALLAFAGPAFGRGSIDWQAACAKGFYRAGQARCLRFAGNREVHVIVFGRAPQGDVIDGDVVDGKRLRLIGASSAVVKAHDLTRLTAGFGVRRIARDATLRFTDWNGSSSSNSAASSSARNSADTWG
jgi:hypothetical protein